MSGRPDAAAREEIRASVAATRAAQGLPPKVEDPGVLERAAAVFRAAAVPDEPARGRAA